MKDGPMLSLATPDQRPRRKSMSRRSGQSGYIEQKGNAYYVRFWIDVPGQEKRAHKSIRICPANGPGRLTKPERERKGRGTTPATGGAPEGNSNRAKEPTPGLPFHHKPEGCRNTGQARKPGQAKPETAAP